MNADLIINVVAFVILGIGWVVFAAALITSPERLNKVWRSFRTLPLIIQIIVALLVLPLWLGLWIWERPWPRWLSLTLVLALGIWTVYTFFPRLT